MSEDQWLAVRAKWRAVLLSTPCSFIGTDGRAETVWIHGFNRRQSIRQDHESLSRTAMQTSLEIDQFKTIVESAPGCKGKLQPAQLAEAFVELGLQSVTGANGRNGDEDGRLTANMITQALMVKKGILSSPKCVEILMELESSFGSKSPFIKCPAYTC